MPDSTQVTVFVCRTCGAASDCPEGTGARLEASVRVAVAAGAHDGAIDVVGVDCLAVCDRPITIAFAAPDKWSYVIGDVSGDDVAFDIVQAALAVGRSQHGVPAMVDRPEFFSAGVVARTPPASWRGM
ncbi:MAG: DUF1636 domain-containing protein [Pseudomonadota bacterium]